MSKKLEQKQARREAEERRKAEQRKQARRRSLLTIGSAVLVGAIVVGAIVAQRRSGEGPGAPDNVGVAAAEANCADVEEFEEQEADHIDTGAAHEPYNSSPPTSGPHYATPAGTEFFAEQIPPEQLVHNLEHGQIVIWYAPDAPAEVQSQVEDLVVQETNATAAAPYPDIEAPYQLVLSAWGASQACEKVSQEVVDDFRREYQGKGPEALTPPFDG